MRQIKSFLEYYDITYHIGEPKLDSRRKQDIETTNKQMITKDWFKSHPFPGVTKVVTHDKSVDIYFGRDSYISIYAPGTVEYSKTGETGTVRKKSSQESITWMMRGSDKDDVLDNKEEFISWVDKLLIKFGMDRSVLKDLDRTIEENRRIYRH